MNRNLFLPGRHVIGRSVVIVLVLFVLGFVLMGGLPPASAQEPLEPNMQPDAFKGLPLFADRCANCHGPEGHGDGEMSADLPKTPRDYSDEEFRRTAVPSVLFQTITSGILESGMPPFGPTSSNPIADAVRWDLVAAVYSLGMPPESMENGRIVYEENCLACHGESGAGDGPEAANSSTATPDLTEIRYWSNRSNEMVFASLQDAEIVDHSYELDDSELWNVVDYARAFSYVYADPQAAMEPIESVSISGQILNGTTDEIINDGMVSLRAFTPDLQEAASLIAPVGENGRYSFEVKDVGPDWVYMSSIEHGDLSFSSSPERLERSEPQLEMPIVVFDTTDDPSAININQVHMIMEFVDDRVQVSEIYVISNLEPAVFVGETGVSDEGTLRLAAPDGAENVAFQRSFRSFENFLPAPEVIPTESGYADTVPVRPGDGAMNLLVSYDLPFEDGMRIEHPVFYETVNSTVVVPGAGVEVDGDGWTDQGSQQMGNAGSISSFAGPSLAAGKDLSFSLEGQPTATAAVGGNTTGDDELTGILIGGTVLLIVAGGAAYTVRNWQSAAEDAAIRQEDQANYLLNSLASLEDAYETGNIDAADYEQRRTKMINELAAVWRVPEN